MRKVVFWTGWVIFFMLPIAFLIEIAVEQDMPPLPLWKLGPPLVALALVVFGRSRDDALNHHLG